MTAGKSEVVTLEVERLRLIARLNTAPRGKVLELRARVKLITQQILALGVEA